MFKSSQTGLNKAKTPSDWAIQSTCPKGQKPGPLPSYKGANVKAGKHHK
jgi:hypothetical protein